jgi:hypothetical protein
MMFACDCVSMKFYLPFRLILPDVDLRTTFVRALENEIIRLHFRLCTDAVLKRYPRRHLRDCKTAMKSLASIASSL